MTIKQFICSLLVLSLCLVSCKKGGENEPDPQPTDVAAFPGAAGGGMLAKGGRGGEVFYVSSLEDKTVPEHCVMLLPNPEQRSLFSMCPEQYTSRVNWRLPKVH